MATQPAEDVIALVRKLVETGKTFSITLEHPDSPTVRNARTHGNNFTFAQGDGKCIEWMQVPGKRVVCTKHEGD